MTFRRYQMMLSAAFVGYREPSYHMQLRGQAKIAAIFAVFELS